MTTRRTMGTEMAMNFVELKKLLRLDFGDSVVEVGELVRVFEGYNLVMVVAFVVWEGYSFVVKASDDLVVEITVAIMLT